MNPRSPRLWLVVFSAFALVALVALVVWALIQSAAAPAGPCPPNCMVTFTTPSMFNPASNEAASIRGLFTFILVTAGIIFVVVEGLLLFAVLRFRNRPPESALQFHGNTRLEIAWTTAPAVILAVLLGFTLQTMGQVRAVAPQDAVHVTAIAHQWWWEFRYPDLNIITANEMVVPVGSVVEVAVEAVDVEHGFWVPELFGKVDAIPGYTNRIRFVPTEARPDYFSGQCTQYCGEQHAQMRFGVVVRSPEEYQNWTRLMQQPAAAPGASVTAGHDLFLNPSTGCVVCHTVAGTQAGGVIGPNLTHVASRTFLAGGVLKLTPENLHAWIKDAPAVKPGVTMPSFSNPGDLQADLTDEQVSAIAAYLLTLK